MLSYIAFHIFLATILINVNLYSPILKSKNNREKTKMHEAKGEIHMKNLVILGGGYGGMRVLQRLFPNQLPNDVEVTLIDKAPYHSLKTEFYALAAGTISDQHVRVAFPEIGRAHV